MALTAVSIDESTSPRPKDIAYLSIGTGNTVGMAAVLAAATASTTGIKPQVIEVISDTAYFWSYQDTQTAAAGTMVPVLAYQPVRFEVGAVTLNVYMKASTGTAKMSVVLL